MFINFDFSCDCKKKFYSEIEQKLLFSFVAFFVHPVSVELQPALQMKHKHCEDADVVGRFFHIDSKDETDNTVDNAMGNGRKPFLT